MAFSYMMTLKGKKVGEKNPRYDFSKESNTVVTRKQSFASAGCKLKLQVCLLLADVKKVFYFLEAPFFAPY